jgi:hypothetical protein
MEKGCFVRYLLLFFTKVSKSEGARGEEGGGVDVSASHNLGGELGFGREVGRRVGVTFASMTLCGKA